MGSFSEGALVLAGTPHFGAADRVPVVHLPFAGCRCVPVVHLPYAGCRCVSV